MMDLPADLEALREAASDGAPLVDLADLAGVSVATLERWRRWADREDAEAPPAPPDPLDDLQAIIGAPPPALGASENPEHVRAVVAAIREGRRDGRSKLQRERRASSRASGALATVTGCAQLSERLRPGDLTAPGAPWLRVRRAVRPSDRQGGTFFVRRGGPRRPPNVTTARRSGEKTRHNRRDSLAFRRCIFVACYTTVETRMTRSDERRSRRARVRTRSTGCRQTARYVRPSAERRSVTPGRCARYGASWVTLTETETLGRSPQ